MVMCVVKCEVYVGVLEVRVWRESLYNIQIMRKNARRSFQPFDRTLIMDTEMFAKDPIYDINNLLVILIDFTSQGYQMRWQMLYARNWAVQFSNNVAAAASRLEAHTNTTSKAERYATELKSFLYERKRITKVCLLMKIILLHYFCGSLSWDLGETFLCKKTGSGDTKIQKEEVMWMCWIIPIFFMLDPCPLTDQLGKIPRLW